MPASPRRGRRWIRPAAIGFGLIVALVLVGWAGINVWLQTDAFARRINRRPDALRIAYDRATMWLPGRVDVRGLRIVGHGRETDWIAELPRARFALDLAALRRREFRASAVRGEGLRWRLRRRGAAAAAAAASRTGLPEIPGSTPDPPDGTPAAPRSPGWSVDLSGIDLRGVEEIWVDGWRLTGRGNLSGDVQFRVHDAIRSPGLELRWSDGRLETFGEAGANALEFTLHAALEPMPLRHVFDADALAGLDVTLNLTADVTRLGFLHPMVRNAERFTLDGAGRLRCEVTFRQGAFLPDSRLELAAERIEATVGTTRLTGDGTLRAGVEAGVGGAPARAWLDAKLEHAAIVGPTTGAPLLGKSRIDLQIVTLRPELPGGFDDPEITLAVPGLEIPDLTALNGLLPRGLGLRVVSGSARVATTLDRHGPTLEGRLTVRGDAVGIDFDGRVLTGDLDVDVGYGAAGAGVASIAGTALRFVAPVPGAAPLELRLEVREGRLRRADTAAGSEPAPSDWRPNAGRFVLGGRVSDLAPLAELSGFPAWLALSGAVDLESTLLVGDGAIRPGSELRLDAERLVARVRDWEIGGRARIGATTQPAGTSELTLEFDEVDLRRGDRPALRAPGLTLHARGVGRDGGAAPVRGTVRLALAPGELLDLALINDWLPDPELLAIRSGHATLGGGADLDGEVGRIRLELDGRELALRIDDVDLTGTVDLDVAARTEHLAGGRYDLKGTRLALASGSGDAAWSGEVRVTGGTARLTRPMTIDGAADLRLSDTRPLLHVLAGTQRAAVEWFARFFALRDVVGTASFHLGEDGLRIEDLDVMGGGIRLESRLDLPSPGGADPGRRQIALRAELYDALQIDLVELNGLFPTDAGFGFEAGTAELRGWVEADERRGTGRLELDGRGLTAVLHGDSIATDLRATVELGGEGLAGRRVDVAGTRIRFEDTRWLGDAAARRAPGWWGELTLNQGEVTLERPLRLDSRVALELRDARPVIYLLGRERRVVRWLDDLIELRDVKGTARLRAGPQGVRLDEIDLGAHNLRVAGRLDLRPDGEYGLFHIRWQHLGVAIELINGRHEFHILEARDWFERRLEALRAAEQADGG